MVLNSKFPIPSLREYIKSLRNIYTEWSSKTPLRKWCYLYGIGKISTKMIGITVFEDDQTLSWYSYMGYIYYGFCTMLAIYTIVYYSLQGESSKGFSCTCMLVGPGYGVSLNFNNFSFSFDTILKVNKKICFIVYRAYRFCIWHCQNVDMVYII